MSNSPTVYQIIIPVWGDFYTDLCIDHLFPSLLSPGNLPYLSKNNQIRLHFCCPLQSKIRFESSELYARISDFAEIRFLDNFPIVASDAPKHSKMTSSIYLSLDRIDTRNNNTIIITLNPDLIISSDFFKFVEDKMMTDIKALMMTGLRVRYGDLIPRIAKYFSGDVLTIPSTTLSKIATAILHPYSSAHIWNEDQFPRWSPLLFYRLSDGGLLQHCFHLHPIAIRCPENIPQTKDTIDGDFLEKCGFMPDEVEVVNTDNNAVFIEVSQPPYEYPGKLGDPSAGRMADYAVYNFSEFHWSLFRQRISYRLGSTDEVDTSEFDALIDFIEINHGRRKYLKSHPRLERKFYRHYYRVLGLLKHSLLSNRSRNRKRAVVLRHTPPA